MRFRSCQRIRRQADFGALRSDGIFKRASGFFVKVRDAGLLYPRFAVVVGKKVGAAHERNYIKRLFREIFRQEQQRLEPRDYLVITRKGIAVNFQSLRECFLNLCSADMNRFVKVAIDGTAASGKSTTAIALAKRLRLLNVNTGDHYRSIVCYLLQQGIHSSDIDAIAKILKTINLGVQFDGITAHIAINGVAFERNLLRSLEVNEQVSFFAKIPAIRQKLKLYQQNLIVYAQKMLLGGIVMEGRDICSVIMPDSDVKLFLTADSKIRAQRRENDQEQDSILQRDAVDQCVHGDDVTVIDTSCHSVEQVVEKIVALLNAI